MRLITLEDYHAMFLASPDGYLVVDGDGLIREANPKAEVLFDTIDGRTKAVNSAPLGEEPVTVGDQEVAARHWRLTGEMERDVWYGPDCAIARVTFPARDGSLITLQRQ